MQFISNDCTKADIWVSELAHITEDLREQEPELRKTRWFDYREKLPMQLTQIFADKYCALYREIYAAHRDSEYAEKLTGFITQSDLVSLWRARQGADSIGCNYEFYIRTAMMRTFERQWKYIPRPNQLYNEELILDVQDAWNLTKKQMLFLAKDDFYKSDNYAGHPDQDDYHEYLVSMVKVRPHPELILTRLIFREKCLTEELAVKHFGEPIFKAASAHFHGL